MSIGQHQQARDYLGALAATGPLKFPVDQAELLQDPYLQAFVGAKGVEADERGVSLRIGPETLVRGQVTEAAGRHHGAGQPDRQRGKRRRRPAPRRTDGWRWRCWTSRAPTAARCTSWSPTPATGWPREPAHGGGVRRRVHHRRARGRHRAAGGQGFGLALARQLARRRGGDVTVLDRGSRGGPGAVFMATLPRTTAGTAAAHGRPIDGKDTRCLTISGC